MAGDGRGREVRRSMVSPAAPRGAWSRAGWQCRDRNSGNQRRDFGERQGRYGWAQAGRKEESGTAGAPVSLVRSGGGRNRSPRGCLGESDRVQMGVPGAGGVRGALRHTSQEAGKEAMLFEAVYGGELGLER